MTNLTPLPDWVLIALTAMVGVVVLLMLAITAFNLSAPRSTLNKLLGVQWRPLKGRGPSDSTKAQLQGGLVTQRLVSALALSAQVNTRTTRTILAIAGFALLGVVTIAVFGATSADVRDLRTQVVAGVVTLVATIVGFYFGQASTRDDVSKSGGPKAATAVNAAPTLAKDTDARHENFTVGVATTYQPVVTGVPEPTLALIGILPQGLTFDRATGRIAGAPVNAPANGTAQDFPLQIVATNGVEPDAALNLTLHVRPPLG